MYKHDWLIAELSMLSGYAHDNALFDIKAKIDDVAKTYFAERKALNKPIENTLPFEGKSWAHKGMAAKT